MSLQVRLKLKVLEVQRRPSVEYERLVPGQIVKPVVNGDIYQSLTLALEQNGEDMEPTSPSGIPQRFLAKLMPAYFRTRDDDLRRLNIALEGSDFEALKGLGHKIKGSAASYGFAVTTALSQKLEDAAEAGDLVACRECVARIEQVVATDRARGLSTSPDADV